MLGRETLMTPSSLAVLPQGDSIFQVTESHARWNTVGLLASVAERSCIKVDCLVRAPIPIGMRVRNTTGRHILFHMHHTVKRVRGSPLLTTIRIGKRLSYARVSMHFDTSKAIFRERTAAHLPTSLSDLSVLTQLGGTASFT